MAIRNLHTYDESINEIQRLQFELFRHARFNLLDGEAVVRDLLQWRKLWFSVIATRLPIPIPGSKSLVSTSELALLSTTRWEDWPADLQRCSERLSLRGCETVPLSLWKTARLPASTNAAVKLTLSERRYNWHRFRRYLGR